MAAQSSLLAAPPSQPVNTGQIVFTEYQARVFNQTEAAYKSNGYLSTPLFEDSYLLSKATATWILENVPLTGTNSSVNTQATATYRGVLGIAAPPPPPPPPPPPGPTGVTGISPTRGIVSNVGVSPVSPQSPVAASTPTVFTPPTSTPTPTPTVTAPTLPTSITTFQNAANNPLGFFGSTNPFANMSMLGNNPFGGGFGGFGNLI